MENNIPKVSELEVKIEVLQSKLKLAEAKVKRQVEYMDTAFIKNTNGHMKQGGILQDFLSEENSIKNEILDLQHKIEVRKIEDRESLKNHLTTLVAGTNPKISVNNDAIIETPKFTKSIFFSHAFLDKTVSDLIVEKLLFPLFSINEDDIYYTSKPETGAENGSPWRESIKQNLKASKIIIFLYSPSFIQSRMCINEVGAAWGLDKITIPIIIDPITPKELCPSIDVLHASKLSSVPDLKAFIKKIRKELSNLNYNEKNEAKVLSDFLEEFDKLNRMVIY